MMRRLPLLAPLLVLMLAAACGGGQTDSAAVPKPVAYPRVDVPDSAYVGVDAPGVTLRVNESADVNVSPSADGAWVDIGYGTFGAPRVYLTLTRCGAGGMDEVMANRRERMGLNLGGQRYELVELTTPSGWQCEMAVARGSLTTPVQILAHNDRDVLSGAAVVAYPDSLPPDPVALAPVVDFLARDMLVMLTNL